MAIGPNTLIWGIKGTDITDQERDLFLKLDPFGFALFKRNMKSEEQVKVLTESLRQLFPDKEIYIFIDQEGGRVDRLQKSGIVAEGFPPAYSFYEKYLSEGLDVAKAELEATYFNMGQHLRSLGINGNFAPVADLFYEEAHSVIGDRSFGPDPEIVVELCKAAFIGLQRAGVEGCIKHIPGHGLAKVDSHVGLPVVDESLEFLEERDFWVFKRLIQELQPKFVMTAHVVYRCLDERNPVTTSKAAIEYIRKNMGFTGTIVTDDVGMGALGDNIAESVLSVLDAGCDVALCCHFPEKLIEKDAVELSGDSKYQVQEAIILNL
jgi:beta-glucosidase-like glycosyl hydrolase